MSIANQARQALSNAVSSLNASFDADDGIHPHRIAGSSGLSEKATEKLRRAKAARDDAHVLYLRASDAERDARQVLNNAQNIARQQLQAPSGYVIDGGVIARPQSETPDARNARVMGPVERAELALKAAVADRERAEAKSNSFVFVSGVEEWLERFGGLGRFRDVETIAPVIKGDPLAAIQSIRSKIAKLTDELAKVDAAPTPAEVLRSQAYAEIDAVAAEGALSIHPRSRSGTPLRLSDKMFIRTAPSGGLIGSAGSDVLVWLLRDQLKSEVDNLIADLNLEGALSVDEQDAAARQIATARLALERQEEAVIEAGEIDGRLIARRNDVDPRAFLNIEA